MDQEPGQYTIPVDKQEKEIAESANFLKKIGEDASQLVFSYPYGAYDDITLDLLKKYNFKLAFSTKSAVADLCEYSYLELPRLDTNDLPKDRSGNSNQWYPLG